MSTTPPTVHFTGRVFRTETSDVTLPNGRTLRLEAVRHRGSVVMIAQPTPDTVVIVRQYRPVIGEWIWELPAGSLEVDEVPELAAARECAEEIGLSPRRVTALGSWFATPGLCDEAMHFYLCEDLAAPEGVVHQDEDEQIEPRTVTVAELRTMVERREVRDMKTVVGLMLLEARAASGRD
jgi:ADP-ribose pyrophosphatase